MLIASWTPSVGPTGSEPLRFLECPSCQRAIPYNGFPVTDEEREECDHHMCGIIAILRRPSTRDVPTADSILTLLVEAVGLVAGPDGGSPAGRSARWVAEAAALTAEADRLLSGVPGLLARERDAGLADRITAVLSDLPGRIAALEALLEDEPDAVDGIETATAALVDLRDASWAVIQDRLGTHAGVASLRSSRIPPSDAGTVSYTHLRAHET